MRMRTGLSDITNYFSTRITGITVLLSVIVLTMPIASNAGEKVAKPDGKKTGISLQQREETARKLEAEGNIAGAARAFMSASKSARHSGNFQKGIAYGSKAIHYSEQQGKENILAWALIQTAKSYMHIAQYQKALSLLEKAADLSSKNRWKTPAAVANEDMGKIYRKLNEQAKALEHMKRAFTYFEERARLIESPSVTLPARRAKMELTEERHLKIAVKIAISMGDLYAGNGDFENALTLYRKALFYASGIKDRTLEIYRSMGDLYFMNKDFEKAAEYHAKACALADTLDVPFYTTTTYARYGRDLRHMGRSEEAVAKFRKAIDAIEDQRSLLQDEEMRNSFFEEMVTTYNAMISALLELGRTEDAFDASERVRARTFLDILGSRLDLSGEKAAGSAAEERELRRKIASLQLRAAEAEPADSDQAEAGDDGDEEEARSDLRQETERLMEEYRNFLRKLRQEDREHASLLSVDSLTLCEVQDLLDPRQVLLEFHVLQDKTILWTVRKSAVQVRVIPRSKKELTTAVRKARKLITSLADADSLGKSLKHLHKLLMQNAGLTKGEELIIVPHDILHYLPFQALMSPEGNYLVEDHAISYLSSASILRFTTEKRRAVGSDVTALGNPFLGDPSYDLRFAEEEVKVIRENFPAARIFVRRDATEERVKDLSGTSSILHIASHAELNETQPDTSAMRLAGGGHEDGNLTVGEIFGLRTNASLVVLSACETELGKFNRGDEITSLTRAFIYAGSPSVISTLWKIEDRATFTLMRSFYRNLKTMKKGEALRSAQLQVMKEFPHPFFWGAFILAGDSL